MTEYLTKWVDAYAIPNKNAETILNCFIQFVCAHGVPEELITDQGREFCNQLNDLFCKKMGITHKVASAYHPQTGGHTERFNRTLSNMLVHYVNENPDDWDTKIPFYLPIERLYIARHNNLRFSLCMEGKHVSL